MVVLVLSLATLVLGLVLGEFGAERQTRIFHHVRASPLARAFTRMGGASIPAETWQAFGLPGLHAFGQIS